MVSNAPRQASSRSRDRWRFGDTPPLAWIAPPVATTGGPARTACAIKSWNFSIASDGTWASSVTRWAVSWHILAADLDLSAHAIIMIGPLSQGSEAADFVHRLRVGRLVLGPALGDRRTGCASSIPRPDCRSA